MGPIDAGPRPDHSPTPGQRPTTVARLRPLAAPDVLSLPLRRVAPRIVAALAFPAVALSARAQVAGDSLASPPRVLAPKLVEGLPRLDGLRTAHVGDTVVVAGRAIVASGVLQPSANVYIAIQGDSGATWVYRRNTQVVVREGDSVQARGTVYQYRGSLEIIASSLTVVPTTRLLTPAPDTGWPAHPLREARLVRVHGKIGSRGESEGGRWLRLHPDDRTDSVTIWVPWTHGDAPGLGDISAGDALDVTGIAQVYADNPGDPMVWQIVPRHASDVRTVGIPHLMYTRLVYGGVAVVVVAVLVLVFVKLLTHRQGRTLRETEERYRQLLALSPDAVLVHDGERVLFANAAAARLLGAHDEHALAGRPIDSFVGEDERLALDAAVGRRASGSTTALGRRVRTVFRGTEGRHVDVEVATSPCRYHDRDAAVIVARDIGPQLRYERELRELALLDELTGLHNRRGFFMFAEAELRRLRERGSYAVLVFADLDGLKQINDRHGHAAGDQALRSVARALRDIVGEQGLAARWSGDEFVALVPDASLASPTSVTLPLPIATSATAAADGESAGDVFAAEAFEQRLVAALARHPASAGAFAVSASIGARRLGPDASETLAAALAAADAGLYRRRGRTRTPSA